jgi:nucleoid-associated protein YgaU
LAKLRIVGYRDSKYLELVSSYSVLFNPEKIKDEKVQQFSTSNSTNGSSSQTVAYKGAGPSNFDVVLFFDGTGIISLEPVESQIERLLQLAYKVNGKIHEPNYLRIYWGTQSLFEGRLKSWSSNHILIDTDGSPLRSELKMSFVAAISPEKRTRQDMLQSSDLTHFRTVASGDTLPLMCHRIYGDSSFYIKVARENKLTNFRDLKPGDKISFPPVI